MLSGRSQSQKNTYHNDSVYVKYTEKANLLSYQWFPRAEGSGKNKANEHHVSFQGNGSALKLDW